MSDRPLDWRTEIAKQVCTLVRDGRVMARFRAMCAAFPAEKKRDEEQLAAWLQRRKEHCERGLRTLRQFKERSKKTELLGKDRKKIERTRPQEDVEKTWIFDYYQNVLSSDDLARLGSRLSGSILIGFGAWVPPELRHAAAPKLRVPLLFGRFTGHLHSPPFGTDIEPGIASMAEKYTTLAAVHDARFPERPPIDQVPQFFFVSTVAGAVEQRGGGWGRFTEELRRRETKARQQAVAALPDAVSASLTEWLSDVEADLKLQPSTEQAGSDARKAGIFPSKAVPPAESSRAEASWLRRIIESIHEDTRDFRKKTHYAKMTRAWADRIAREGRWKGTRLLEYLRQEHPGWTEEEIESEIQKNKKEFGGQTPMKFRNDSVAITTHQATPLDKKYATLAAIHDELHGCDYPLSPWKGEVFRNPFREDATEKDAEDLAAWNFYRTLREDVLGLTDDDRPGIEAFLTEVGADLGVAVEGRKNPPKTEVEESSLSELSEPMLRSDLARRIFGGKKQRARDVEPLLKQYGFQPVPGTRMIRVRLDQMDANTRRKVETPTA